MLLALLCGLVAAKLLLWGADSKLLGTQTGLVAPAGPTHRRQCRATCMFQGRTLCRHGCLRCRAVPAATGTAHAWTLTHSMGGGGYERTGCVPCNPVTVCGPPAGALTGHTPSAHLPAHSIHFQKPWVAQALRLSDEHAAPQQPQRRLRSTRSTQVAAAQQRLSMAAVPAVCTLPGLNPGARSRRRIGHKAHNTQVSAHCFSMPASRHTHPAAMPPLTYEGSTARQCRFSRSAL